MPERLTTTATLVGCLLHGAAYGACLRLFGMPADALLLGAVSAGIAHGLHTVTTRKAGWARIGIGTLLAGAGAPIVAASLFGYPEKMKYQAVETRELIERELLRR